MYEQLRKSAKTSATPPKSAAVASHLPVASSLPNSVLLSLQRYGSRAGAGIWPREKEAAGLADGVIQRKIIHSGKELSLGESVDLLRKCCAPSEYMLSVLEEMVREEKETSVENDSDLAGKIKERARENLGITEEEQKALDKYQGPGYREMNKALREGDRLGKSNWNATAKSLDSALKKLPKPKGTVYRMVSFKTKEERDAFLKGFEGEGNVYATPQFDSTTFRPGASVQIPQALYKVHMTIHIEENELGGDIASVISMPNDYEQEVLFPPGTIYHVIGGLSEISQSDRDKPGALPIELEVIGQDEAVRDAALSVGRGAGAAPPMKGGTKKRRYSIS